MKSLFRNIRFYILVCSALLSCASYYAVQRVVPSGILQTIRLEQWYALCSVVFLYITLTIGPLLCVFPQFPLREYIHKGRRALGVSAFYFGALHGAFAFFGQLQGFHGLRFLSPAYQFAIGISAVALAILFLLAITSVDRIITWMTFRRWKMLHRCVYVAGILILVHALLLGTHMQDLSGIPARISFVLLVALFALEAKRINVATARYIPIPSLRIGSLLVIAIAIAYCILATSPSLNIHRGHQASYDQSS